MPAFCGGCQQALLGSLENVISQLFRAIFSPYLLNQSLWLREREKNWAAKKVPGCLREGSWDGNGDSLENVSKSGRWQLTKCRPDSPHKGPPWSEAGTWNMGTLSTCWVSWWAACLKPARPRPPSLSSPITLPVLSTLRLLWPYWPQQLQAVGSSPPPPSIACSRGKKGPFLASLPVFTTNAKLYCIDGTDGIFLVDLVWFIMVGIRLQIIKIPAHYQPSWWSYCWCSLNFYLAKILSFFFHCHMQEASIFWHYLGTTWVQLKR